jgi:transcriptional regulator with XRE-family HTH domain
VSAGPPGLVPGSAPQGSSAWGRLMLGAQLRQFREAARVSLDQAAYHIRGSVSKISRLETGKVGFKERDVADLLALYGVTDQEVLAGMLALAGQANAQAWWARFADVLPGWFEPYLGLEASASVIRSFDLQHVNGLLQTRQYAWAVISLGLRKATAAEISRRVGVRLRRQELLTSPDGPRLWAILDEAALRRPVGSQAVMTGQLRHLVDASDLPSVTIQVIPFSRGAHDAAGGSFTLLRFAAAEISDVVYIEQLTGASYLDKRRDLDHYLDVVNRLGATALSPEATTEFLRDMISEAE